MQYDDERPIHPDFWRLSEIILQMDAWVSEDNRPIDNEVAQIIDVPSVTYMARGRSKRGMQNLSLEKKGAPITLDDIIALSAALWLDGFLAGVRFLERGGRQ